MPADAMTALLAETPPEGGVSEDEVIAGEDFAKAVKSGDGAEVARTYKALKEICEANSGGLEGEY